MDINIISCSTVHVSKEDLWGGGGGGGGGEWETIFRQTVQ